MKEIITKLRTFLKTESIAPNDINGYLQSIGSTPLSQKVKLESLILRPEKKRTKQMNDMLDNLQVADEVVTTGGIIGRVVSIKEDTVLLETGSDRTKIRILKSSIAKNNTVHDE